MTDSADQVTLNNVLDAIGDVPVLLMNNPTLVDCALIGVAVIAVVGLLNAFALVLASKLEVGVPA